VHLRAKAGAARILFETLDGAAHDERRLRQQGKTVTDDGPYAGH